MNDIYPRKITIHVLNNECAFKLNFHPRYDETLSILSNLIKDKII